MAYDPADRGPHDVIVDDGALVDDDREHRRLPYRIWRPATPERSPLIVYSHASYGARDQSSFLCTHLASHGYVVAAVDHSGNTRAEWAPRPTPLSADERTALIARIIADRVPDVRFLIDEMLSTYDRVLDASRIGLVGWSFGGWAVLATPERDDRVSSIVALAPAGARDPLPNIIPAQLTFEWPRRIATLVIAAERDRFTPLDRVRDVFERMPEPKRLFVLAEADHGHFADEIQPEGPPSADIAHRFVRELSLAHLDATLRDDPRAEALLAARESGA